LKPEPVLNRQFISHSVFDLIGELSHKEDEQQLEFT